MSAGSGLGGWSPAVWTLVLGVVGSEEILAGLCKVREGWGVGCCRNQEPQEGWSPQLARPPPRQSTVNSRKQKHDYNGVEVNYDGVEVYQMCSQSLLS